MSSVLTAARPHRAPTPTTTVAVVGLGYVGLPTAIALRTAGHRVVGLDVDPRRIDLITRGGADLLPHDQDRLGAYVGRPGFALTGDPAALAGADAVVVCVPTPVDRHLVPDLTALRAACETVVRHARAGQTIVLASTSYVGTTRELLVGPLAARGLVPGHDVHVACAPERVDPGRPKHAQETTTRVVGGLSPACGLRAAEILRGTAGAIHTVGSPEAAELTKLLENTFRAVNISLANEFADIAGGLGLDPAEIVEAAATKPFGFMPFWPGPGAGGHCIPCDPHYLLWQSRARRTPLPVTEAAMTALAARPGAVAERALGLLAERGVPRHDARVLVVGVAYKPGVADVRESPAVEILAALSAAGVRVAYTDPLIPALTAGGRVLRHLDPWAPAGDPEDTGPAWDLVVVHTAHPGQDLTWLDERTPVLDATYRLRDVGHRVVL
ncbi:nucleotide sugar dehydrogenase [Streptomyces sp. RFCAC02]|uniref:nucleotide sugar dehydrogenase n=1 Tax=Streptomyces sp. RFCAC02 TaxID=2499143 RepID=UPI001020B111|nr:nucleotide sugar dehydrogenase [Streptomyces sp. RFCAC02]